MIQVIALLYASKEGIEGLREFESQAVQIFREHGGRLISASFNENRSEGEPDEIHVIQFPKIENLEAYKKDVRVINLAPLKSKKIRKMEVFLTDSFYEY